MRHITDNRSIFSSDKSIENIINSRAEILCERLRSQFGCLGKERDSGGSDFWDLRLGTYELKIPHTRPLAIGFDDYLR